jgi:hypothetical protein
MPEYKRLLAIDPGGTTGIAYRAYNAAPMLFISGGTYVDTMTETRPENVWTLVTCEAGWDQVICEKFTGQGHMNKVRVDVIELVGGIRALCVEHGIPFAFRTPQNRKAYQSEAKAWLKAQGTPYMDHQEDALAHLLAWEDIGEREKRSEERERRLKEVEDGE